jgi:pyruvate kinase
MKKTKIIATIGPATNNYEMMRKLANAGVDIFRFNFSHSKGDSPFEEELEIVKKIRKDDKLNVESLADIQGPKIRLGEFSNGSAFIEKGEKFFLTTENIVGDRHGASVDYNGLIDDVIGCKVILINDGLIQLAITGISGNKILTNVVQGGVISDHKGVNVHKARISLPPLTDKDKNDIGWIRRNDFQYLAASFVRTSRNILDIRELAGPNIKIISKIETGQAILNIRDIIGVSDGILIARGDMGVEIPFENVPIIQKVLISLCNKQNKFVITATQMLESMIQNPFPTRAEITDIANAVIDGTDAVMLSGETAVGKYPFETVETMQKILTKTETAWEDSKIEYSDILDF